jgi:AcrR family transcriptional regulator
VLARRPAYPSFARVSPLGGESTVPYGRPVQKGTFVVREPKQERSRLSFDRAVDAAVELLIERGSDAFTFNDVAARAGVSTGSIYGRVDSKDDLLRFAHAREMARISDQQKRLFEESAPPGEPLAASVRRLVATTSQFLRDNAAVMGPFMLLANSDDVIADAGRVTAREMLESFRTALLRADIRHPEPERAIAWSFRVVYSVVARWLGLGGDAAAAGEGDWDQMLADLSEMVTAFLGGPGSAQG